jgi:hypothetical protein
VDARLIGKWRKRKDRRRNPTPTIPTGTLTTAQADTLLFMREEEKLARDVYLALYDEWQNPVFSRIANSEQQHMNRMADMLFAYNLPDPVATDEPRGDFDNLTLLSLYEKLVDLGEENALVFLQVGAWIEETDIADLVDAIASLADDAPLLTRAYQSLLNASYNHLQCFVGAIETTSGEPYVPQDLGDIG